MHDFSDDYRFSKSPKWDGTARIYAQSSVDPSVSIGPHVIIWRYTTILEETSIGPDCILGTCIFIGRRCQIGAGTRIHPGAALPDNAIVGERCFIGANVVLADVAYPNLRDKSQEVHRPPIIEDDVVLGSNAVILPGVTVHRGAVVGAGSIVTHDVQAGTVVKGNPARPARARTRRVKGLSYG